MLNDFGTALLFLGIFLAMIYLATGRAAYTAFGIAVFLAGSALVYAAVPRIQSRVNNWLHPFDDPAGQGYQLVQSLYALAQGGVIGPGLGRAFLVADNGNTIVPALQTDFMFSAVASELGYVGGVASCSASSCSSSAASSSPRRRTTVSRSSWRAASRPRSGSRRS